MMNAKRNIILSSFLLIAFYSCNKSANDDVDISDSTFETTASVYSDELDKSADAVTFNKVQNGSNGPGIGCLPECASVTIEYPNGLNYPKIITIDYGDVNCQVRPNLYKRGKIMITLTDTIVNLGAQRIVTFDSFYINDNLVTGSRELTNLGENDNSNITFSINNEVSVGEWTRQAEGTKIWIEGLETMSFEDNVFLLTGSSTTTRPGGSAVNKTITESLRIDRSCGYITEGVLTIESPNQSAIIDFGDGECDDIAIITTDGQEFEIDLDNFRPRRRH